MITRKCSSDARNACFNPSFFRGVVRRAWPKLLCYSLLLFFILPLPILFEINERRNKTASIILERLDRLLTNNLWLYCLAAVALAVFAGMLATRYLTRRPSVDYYHSLPMRRESLLIAHWLEGAVHFASALCFNLLLTLAVIGTVAEVGSGFGTVIGKLTLCVAYILMVFLLFYTLTVFCGMLCGTSVMQVMVTGLTLGTYPLFRLLLIVFAEDVTAKIDLFSMAERGWRFTSPILRLFYLSGTDVIYGADRNLTGSDVVNYTARNIYLWENPFLWWEVLLWIAATALLFVGALLLYRRRHVERAGTPVVFDGVAAAVRWVVVLLGTMGLGWLFKSLGNGGIFWLFFGFLLGGFLAFILVGTLLTKNPKQMFEGWRRLIIYLVLFCLLFIGFSFGCSAVDGWVPKNIDRISLYFNNENYCVSYYEDPAVIAAWQEMQKAKSQYNEDILYETVDKEVYDTYIYDETARNIRIRAYVKIGPVVIPYRAQSYLRTEAKELLRAVADSEEFEAGWDLMMAEVRRYGLKEHDPLRKVDYVSEVAYPNYSGETAMYPFFADAYASKVGKSVNEMKTSDYNRNSILAPMTEEIEQAVLADLDRVDFDFFQSPVYAMVTVPNFTRVMSSATPYNNLFYLYLHMSAPSLYREVMGVEEDAFYEAMADTILSTEYGGLYVAKRVKYSFSLQDDHVMKITDRAQIIEVLRGMSILAYGEGTRPISAFTVYDDGYGIVFPNGGSSDVTYFIDGKVPAFVKSTLG